MTLPAVVNNSAVVSVDLNSSSDEHAASVVPYIFCSITHTFPSVRQSGKARDKDED